MAMMGNLCDFSLSDLLHILGRGGKTGQLSIWSPNGLYSIWLYQGRVVSAVSPDYRYQLQPMLESHVDAHMVNDRMMSKLGDLCCNVNEPVGICLKRQDLVSPMVLVQIFRQQLQMGIYSLFVLEAGEFSFKPDTRLPYGEMTGLSKAATEVALEGLRWLSENETNKQNMPSAEYRFFKIGEGLPLLQLSALEWRVWEQITPLKSIREISLFLEDDLDQVRQICSRFLRLGMIERCPSLAPNSAESVAPFAGSGSLAKNQKNTANIEPKKVKDGVGVSLLSRLTTVLRGIRS